VWLASGGAPHGSDVVQECEIGLVRIRRGDGRLAFEAPKLLRDGPVDAETLRRVTTGLRLEAGAVVAASWADNGPGWLAVLLRSRDAVLAVRPDYAALSGLRVGVVGPWDPVKDGTEAQFEVRAFTATGYEDPVTGSLNASVAQWLIGAGIAPASYLASQGTALGRAGRVYVERQGPAIWVGGAVTTCIAGTVTL
jgi:PhzF family phenazine biosynthesis protein